MKKFNINITSNFNIPSVNLAIGNFDGIHIGHQKIIQKLVNESKKMNVQTIEGKIFLSKNYLKPIFLLLTKSIVIKT